MTTTETVLTKTTNGSKLEADELEFIQTMPAERWLLCRVEQQNLSQVLEGFEVRRPFVTVVAVGPEIRHDVKAGDQIIYAEALNLPKELEKVKWTRKYCWVHENKFLGRLPRNNDDKELKVLKPPVGEGDDQMVRFIATKAKKAFDELQTKMGKTNG